MKKNILFVFALLALSLYSCDEAGDLKVPEMDVNVDKQEVEVGEPVKFNISGDADYLLFYSGEVGSSYEYHDVPRVYPADIELVFSTRLEGGNQTAQGLLKVLYSSDFSGEYSKDAVGNATWVDITDKFTIPDKITSSPEPSGSVDMKPVFEASGNKAVFLAFQYNIEAFDAGKNNERTVVYIYDFALNATSELADKQVLGQATANWKVVRFGEGFDDDRFGPNNNAERLCLKCSPKPASSRQAYAISPAIKPELSVDMGPDTGRTIKTFVDVFPQEFEYTYTAPGEYEITFVAVNSVASGSERVCKTVKVSVVDNDTMESGGELLPVEKE